jgi:gamma-glutamylcyclotransferase (GGCT)/AIG2-like uncharacterized protein YtfP
MPLLFSYGTLQQKAVQLETFGRSLEGRPDVLYGFAPALVPIADPRLAAKSGGSHYANAAYTGRGDDQVRGTVLEVTEAELAAADQYEAPANYERVRVTLASGAAAWVYVHAGGGPSHDHAPHTTR